MEAVARGARVGSPCGSATNVARDVTHVPGCQNAVAHQANGGWEALVTIDDRYDISGLPEAQFEPGSNEQVLKNRLGITSKEATDSTEARALRIALQAGLPLLDFSLRALRPLDLLALPFLGQ